MSYIRSITFRIISKALIMVLLVVLIIKLICNFTAINGDFPCVGMRTMANESIVCVCNSTYCDTVTRRELRSGQFAAYTSSKGGLRFHVTEGLVEEMDKNFTSSKYTRMFVVDPSKTYQTIEGFGGAVTDTAGMLWRRLPEDAQQKFIEAYYGETGIEYNMLRLPIGSSDFSTHLYAYNDEPKYDAKLTNFTLSFEDYNYKIPMVKASFAAATDEVHVVSAVWSPPGWMKTNNLYYGGGRLKEEYFQTFADYHCRFIELYNVSGIQIWGVTPTNEPSNGALFNVNRIPVLAWTVHMMKIWLPQYFGPTIRACSPNTKILAGDDQKNFVAVWFNDVIHYNASALQYIDGIAVHFYQDNNVPPSIVSPVTQDYPDKFIINTESCLGVPTSGPILGQWKHAEIYTKDILADLNYNLVGWLDWNLCLDMAGGPSCVGTQVDAAILVDVPTGTFYKQPMYYAMGHFSKFLPRGSKRVGVTKYISRQFENIEIRIELDRIPERESLDNVAFLTPRGTMVVIIYNQNKVKQIVGVIIGKQLVSLEIESMSITTIEFPWESK